MFSIGHSGNFNNLEKFLTRMKNGNLYEGLDMIAQEGVSALASYTPRNSGVTADSWDYRIDIESDEASITWINTNVQNGFSVAIGLQYGHGTGTGGWVSGYDYINPAIRPIFDKLSERVWKTIQSA